MNHSLLFFSYLQAIDIMSSFIIQCFSIQQEYEMLRLWPSAIPAYLCPKGTAE